MRIALVHRDLHQVTRGGLCTLYRALAREMAARGQDVFLVTQDTGSPVTQRSVATVTLPRTNDLEAHQRAVTAALAACRPDVAECSTWEYELLDYARQPVGQRAPVLVRGDLSAATMGARALIAGETQLLAAADAVVAVSRFAAADLQTAYGVHAAVIPNGVDRTRFHPAAFDRLPNSGRLITLDREGAVATTRDLPAALAADPRLARDLFARPAPAGGPVRLVWVGKITQMKGWDRLQRLAARLAPVARLLVVLGHGIVQHPVTLPRLPSVAVVQDLGDQDLPRVYRAADYLLSTSRWEGFGLAIAEALACGVPALLPAELGVAAELIHPGVTGLTYRDDDDLLALLAARPQLQATLPLPYTWAANADATVAIYRTLRARRAAALQEPDR